MPSRRIILPGHDQAIALETRRGRSIPTSRPQPLPPDAMRASDKLWHTKLGQIETRSLDSTYNCVGMVLASRRAWIKVSHINVLLQDDEYVEISRDASVPGDLVLYYDDEKRRQFTHVGLIVKKQRLTPSADWHIQVLSKWGAEGEYFHPETTVPELFGEFRTYFSERKCL